jgi:type VII secretion protein EccE
MTARIALAALFIVPAVMAYPWRSAADRWLLGTAVLAVLVLFAWWRGSFVTTIIGRRLAMWRRWGHSPRKLGPLPLAGENHTAGTHQSSVYTTTVLLRVDGSNQEPPLALIAGYLDRYGIRCDKIRVTSRDLDGLRTTWISLTLRAVDNLTALRARSARIPLRETTDVVGRRLADHLRETGWNVTPVDAADAPVRRDAKETWRGLRDSSGYVAAYRVDGDLADVRALPSSEIWTALEMTGTADDLRTAAACAIRTHDKPEAIAGATPLNGRHRPALDALSPMSVERLTRT